MGVHVSKNTGSAWLYVQLQLLFKINIRTVVYMCINIIHGTYVNLFISSASRPAGGSSSSSWQMAAYRSAHWSVGWLVGQLVRVGLCQAQLRALIVCLPTQKWNRWSDKYLLSDSAWRRWWNKRGKCTKHVCLTSLGCITLSKMFILIIKVHVQVLAGMHAQGKTVWHLFSIRATITPVRVSLKG